MWSNKLATSYSIFKPQNSLAVAQRQGNCYSSYCLRHYYHAHQKLHSVFSGGPSNCQIQFHTHHKRFSAINLKENTDSKKHRHFPILPVTQTLPSENLKDEVLNRSRIAQDVHCRLEAACRSGGGEKGAKRHVETNRKVLVRDRISGILDPGADFFEICLTAGMGLDYGDVPCGGTVAGIGQISGISVMLMCNDATVKGGTSYPITVTKSLRIQEIAAQNGLPCLYVVDSGGAFLPLQSEIFPDAKHGGRSFANQALMSAAGIPQV